MRVGGLRPGPGRTKSSAGPGTEPQAGQRPNSSTSVPHSLWGRFVGGAVGQHGCHPSGVWGAGVGAGIAIGPLLSALLERVHSWHDAYRVLAVAFVVLAVAAERLVPESRSEHQRGLDIPGALLLAGGISALVEGRQGWIEPMVIVRFVVAAVVLALFILVEYRSPTSMPDHALLRSPAFVAETLSAFVAVAGVIALMSNMSRIPGVGESSGWARFLPGLIIVGIATGVINAALGREAVASVPAGRGHSLPDRRSTGSGRPRPGATGCASPYCGARTLG